MNDQKRLAVNRFHYRLIGLLLCLTVLIGTCPLLVLTSSVSAQPSIDDLNTQKQALADRQAALAAQRDEAADSFESQKQQSDIIRQQIDAKSSEIDINEQLLEVLSEKINEKTVNIASYEKSIVTLDGEIDEAQQELRVRLRQVSKKSGITTFIQAILNSRNYTDYLIGFKISEQLSARSEQLMQEIEQKILKAEQLRNQAKTDKAALEIEHAQATRVRAELESGKANLQTLYEESNAVSESLLQDIHYLNEQIAAIDAQQLSLQGTINDVMEQIRLEEEEARRQEEEARTSTTTIQTTVTTTKQTTTTTIKNTTTTSKRKTTTTTTKTTTTTATTTTTVEETTTLNDSSTTTSNTSEDTTTTVEDDTTTSSDETTTTAKKKTTTSSHDTTATTKTTTTTTKKKTTTTKKGTTTTTTKKPSTTTTKPSDTDDSDEEEVSVGSMLWPAPTCDVITSSFKYREQFERWHYGVDIACYGDAEGEPVVAAADGKVRYANSTDTWGGGYGLYMILDHGKDDEGRRILTVYAHCSEVVVEENDKVKAGDVIGYIGNTGNSYGAHLHFEVQVDGTAVDPVENGYLSTEGIDILA